MVVELQVCESVLAMLHLLLDMGVLEAGEESDGEEKEPSSPSQPSQSTTDVFGIVVQCAIKFVPSGYMEP